MNQVLKLKTWQIFVVLISPRLLMLLFFNSPTIVNTLISLNPILYFGFFMLSYEFLRPFEQKTKPIRRIFFHLLSIAFIFGFHSILRYGYTLDFIETVLLMPIILLTILYILYVLARQLSLAEKVYHLSSQGTFTYMLLFLFLPVGLWVLVPQFKRLKEVRQLT